VVTRDAQILSESQQDSVSKPRVARNELSWESKSSSYINLEKVVAVPTQTACVGKIIVISQWHNSFGVDEIRKFTQRSSCRATLASFVTSIQYPVSRIHMAAASLFLFSKHDQVNNVCQKAFER